MADHKIVIIDLLYLSLNLSPTPPQVTKLERDKVQEVKRVREQEQHRHTATLTEQRAKWHEEKQKDVQGLRESLTRQHEQELARHAKIKDQESQRLKAALNAMRDGSGEKVRLALESLARSTLASRCICIHTNIQFTDYMLSVS